MSGMFGLVLLPILLGVAGFFVLGFNWPSLGLVVFGLMIGRIVSNPAGSGSNIKPPAGQRARRPSPKAYWEYNPETRERFWVREDGDTTPMPKTRYARSQHEWARDRQQARKAWERTTRQERQSTQRARAQEPRRSQDWYQAAQEKEDHASWWQWASGFEGVSDDRKAKARKVAEEMRENARRTREEADHLYEEEQRAWKQTAEGRAHTQREAQVSEADSEFASWKSGMDRKTPTKQDYWKAAKQYHPDKQKRSRRDFGDEMMKRVNQYFRDRGIKV